MSDTQSTVRELREYVRGFTVRCRASQWFGALFHAGVISDIVEDEVKTHEKIERVAYSSAVHDEEAIAKLLAAMADGLDESDLPAIKDAISLISRSAEADRKITEIARMSTEQEIITKLSRILLFIEARQPEPAMTVRAFAKRIGVSPNTVTRYIQRRIIYKERGRIPAHLLSKFLS